MEQHTMRGVLCTLIGGICWGFSGACGQYLFEQYPIDSTWVTAVRMLVSSLLLLILLAVREKRAMFRIFKVKRDALQLLLFGLFGLLCCQFAYLTAIRYSNAGTATVLQYLGPILILGLVCVHRRTLPTLREFIAIALAVLGTFLLATHGNLHTLTMSPKGLFWGLAAAVGLCLYSLIPTKLIPKYGTTSVSGYGMLLGGVILCTGMQIWKQPVVLDGKGWLAMAAIIIIGTVLAFTLYLQGVSDIGAVKASMLASVEPVSATLFAAGWLGSAFTTVDLIGMGFILATVFLLAKPQTASDSEKIEKQTPA